MKIGTYETHPAADLFPLLEGEEFESLKASVKARGIEEPVLLFCAEDGVDLVLDGRNRLRACLDAGVEPEFRWFDGDDPYEYVWAINAHRRHLKPGQKAALRYLFDQAQLDELSKRRKAEADKARGARAAARKRGEDGTFEPDQSVTPASPTGPEERKTRSELAKRADVGVQTAQKVITLAKRDPETLQQVAAGEVELGAASRKLKRDEAIERFRKEPQPLPDGQYRVIVADPPWPYEVRNDDPTHRGAIPYHSMTLEQICAMPVGNHAQGDSILWLWTTNAFMDEAFDVVRAWGFQPKTILTWVKPRIGAGNWLRNLTEHAILAVRGKPVVNLGSQSTALMAPAGTHSEKPDDFYRLVDGLCPGSKLELFARRARAGWTCWGSELGVVVRDEVAAPQIMAPAGTEFGDVAVKVHGIEGNVIIAGFQGSIEVERWHDAPSCSEGNDLLARASEGLDEPPAPATTEESCVGCSKLAQLMPGAEPWLCGACLEDGRCRGCGVREGEEHRQPCWVAKVATQKVEEDLPWLDGDDWMGAPAGAAKVGRAPTPAPTPTTSRETQDEVRARMKEVEARFQKNRAKDSAPKRKAKKKRA